MKIIRKIRIFFIKLARVPMMVKAYKMKQELQEQVEQEPGDPKVKTAMIKRYNGIIEKRNAEVEGVEDMVRKQMKKNAKAFDLKLFGAAKSKYRYLHYRNLATEYDFDPIFYVSNKKMKGYKSIKLRDVRKNFVKLGIDYKHMTVNKIYAEMTRLQKEKENA